MDKARLAVFAAELLDALDNREEVVGHPLEIKWASVVVAYVDPDSDDDGDLEMTMRVSTSNPGVNIRAFHQAALLQHEHFIRTMGGGE